MILKIFAPRIPDNMVVEWGELVVREKEDRVIYEKDGWKHLAGDSDPILGVTGKWMWNPPQWPVNQSAGEDYWHKHRKGAWWHGHQGFDLTSYNIFDADDDVMMHLSGFYPLVDKVRQGEGTMERGDDETIRCWWQMSPCVRGPKMTVCTPHARIWPVYSKPL